jgi:hypothetical protein
MKKTALLALIVVAMSSPSMAKSHHHRHVYREASHHRVHQATSHHRDYAEKPASSHAHITCDMVRAYVAQVGLVQARAMAQSAGMTTSEERRAMRCLDNKV